MKLALLISQVCFFAVLAAGADLEEYNIDFQGPARLTERPLRIPTPTRLIVYVTGPKMDHDKRSFAALLGSSPAYATTNYAEITNLVAALCGETDNTARITNATRHVGYTYHVLLFQDADQTVMHFRVLEFTDVKTEWYDVWPRSDTSFGYFNRPIGPWLHEHVKTPTNAPAAAR
ncbi:MAG: hypothetical protein ACTHLW_19765 [Verrucomicrobiota bacterium]